ncbi:MAG: hypothetical protein JWO85_1048, partial [Candidatus Eremiobacteraeota bacterium]|nr:hypothetical protein [Candidatus Eremiobacteraeota bacterium]
MRQASPGLNRILLSAAIVVIGGLTAAGAVA